ncbi:unnamed protein product [Tetraodon nigroviridis]|uniref:(spotted green pufferfish) hypothetical protein n=1 Tax=Tetraodon nigroviridis TaxID=99883 RepID=Q4S481_TETNG|nr:unnamed protein product [Tetraodon nigroviridis]
MSPRLLTLLLVHSLVDGRSAVREVSSTRGQDGVLACGAEADPGVRYWAVRWYKLRREPSPGLRGLLTKELPSGQTHWYNNTDLRTPLILLDGSHSISLRNLTCADGGWYACHLSAPVGEQNREGEVLLTLTDCPESDGQTHWYRNTSDAFWAALPVLALVFAFLAFGISYLSLKNSIRGRSRSKRRSLEAPLQPLGARDLMLIYRLGPNPKPSTSVCEDAAQD